MQVRLDIDSVDRTSALIVTHPVGNPWSLALNKGAEIDVASFSLDDPTSILSVVEGKEVLITQTDVSPEVRIFGGIATQVQQVPSGFGRVLNVIAQDWTILLHRATVDKDYASQTDKVIIADIFSEAGITELDVATNVQAIHTFDNLRFTGHTLYQVLDLLAEVSGAVWYIDPDKNLIYQAASTSLASFSLSDSPNDSSSFGYWNLQHFKDVSSLYNEVVVRGGKELSADKTGTHGSDGVLTVFAAVDEDGISITDPPSGADTAFTPQGVERVEVFVNTNTNASPTWTQQGVGLEDEDTLGASFDGKTVDVLWNQLARRLEFNTAPPNFADNAYQVKGRYRIQIQVKRRNAASIASLGRTFSKTIVDLSILTTNMAIDVALAFLNENGITKEQVVCQFDHDGLKILDRITFVNSGFGINASFLTQALKLDFQGGKIAFYTATLGDRRATLARIFAEIHEATRVAASREEVRTDVEDITTEIIEIVDEILVSRELGPSYYVGDDVGAVFDLVAAGTLTDTVALAHPFHLVNDHAGWELSLFYDETDTERRGPATALICEYSEVQS